MATRRGMQQLSDRQLVLVTTREAIRQQTIKILNGVLSDVGSKTLRWILVDMIRHDVDVRDALREFIQEELRNGRT